MAHGDWDPLAVVGMTYGPETDTGVDRTANVPNCNCGAVDRGRPSTDGVGGGCDGGDPWGDSERGYVKPEIRVVKQGIVKRRRIGQGRQW